MLQPAPRRRRRIIPSRVECQAGEVVTPPTNSWAQQASEVCGGDACIRNTRYTIWGLVEWSKLGLSDAEILERHPDLTQADLQVAWDYYRECPEEIDQAIRDNEGT
jgi:uncharacterized protein (DUF433 family)